MADPISMTSGLLTLVVFAAQSSQLLYQAVASFRSSQRTIRELKEELEALDKVLQSLQRTVTDANIDVTSLKLPLLRCGKACVDFEVVIANCTKHSGGPRTSFRDWAKLRYMGDDVVGFKNMLSQYKSTIIIALGDANLRNSAVTANVLKEYQELIANTTSDLQEHLQAIDSKLQAISLQGDTISDENVIERQQILEERDSTQQCLDICAQVVRHIEQVQFNAVEPASGSVAAYQRGLATVRGLESARLGTFDAIKACRDTLIGTANQLESRLQDINKRLQIFPLHPTGQPNTNTIEEGTIKEEKDSIQQCLAICAQASVQADRERVNLFEDIAISDDSHSVLVSTIGELISAKRITVGKRSLHWMGQMSDSTLQQLSKDRGQGSQRNPTDAEVDRPAI